ncbi:hypothetical protein [Mechercharimyces sp. CAU 1602]|nr:hypothetical protein [Mechercharimyces sp. CAU 1602]MCS1350885.1 hypothetical protein [Mechercharimyces sp. CAU 1602]
MSVANYTRYVFTGGNLISYSDLDGHIVPQFAYNGDKISKLKQVWFFV